MARPYCIEYVGAVYHVNNRGNDHKAVFRDDQDRETFLKILARLNKRYNKTGHLFPGRYKAVLIEKDRHLLGEAKGF